MIVLILFLTLFFITIELNLIYPALCIRSAWSFEPDHILAANHQSSSAISAISRRPVEPLKTPACTDGAETPPDGRQFYSDHGQGRFEKTDREHEVPGHYGALAPVEKYRSVSHCSVVDGRFRRIRAVFATVSLIFRVGTGIERRDGRCHRSDVGD